VPRGVAGVVVRHPAPRIVVAGEYRTQLDLQSVAAAQREGGAEGKERLPVERRRRIR